MERLEEMLLGIGKLLQQRQEQMQERISLLEKRIEELEAKLVPDSCQVDIPNSMETVIPEEKEEDAVVEVVEQDVEDVVDEDVAVDDFVESVEEDVPVGDMEIEEEIVGEEEEDAGAAPEIEIEFEFDDEDEYVDEEVAGGAQEILIMDKAKPEWYDWEVDIPGPHIDDIWDGIGLNDRLLFLRELFYGNEEDFRDVVARLNTMERLVQVTELIRERYPQWDEESDEVYRFYMTVRRRFNK